MRITRVPRRSGTTLLSRKTSEKWNPVRGMRELPGTPTPDSLPPESHVWLGESSEGPWEDTPTCALPNSALGGPGRQTAPHLKEQSRDKRIGESTDTYALKLSDLRCQFKTHS